MESRGHSNRDYWGHAYRTSARQIRARRRLRQAVAASDGAVLGQARANAKRMLPATFGALVTATLQPLTSERKADHKQFADRARLGLFIGIDTSERAGVLLDNGKIMWTVDIGRPLRMITDTGPVHGDPLDEFNFQPQTDYHELRPEATEPLLEPDDHDHTKPNTSENLDDDDPDMPGLGNDSDTESDTDDDDDGEDDIPYLTSETAPGEITIGLDQLAVDSVTAFAAKQWVPHPDIAALLSGKLLVCNASRRSSLAQCLSMPYLADHHGADAVAPWAVAAAASGSDPAASAPPRPRLTPIP